MITDRLVKALRRRRNAKDEFRAKYGYSWDYVMVFKVYLESEPVSDRQCKFSMRYCLQRLAEGGLEVRLFYSLQVRSSCLPQAFQLNPKHISSLFCRNIATRSILQDPRLSHETAEAR